MLIFLVGFMGSGKTTAGQMAASKSGYAFIDLDWEIEKKTGRSVTDLFREEGQDHFRLIETETLHELAEKKKTIVAVGGGCPCINENMEWMNDHGVTVYLKAHHGTLFHRLIPAKRNRPLIAHLTDVQLMEYILSQLPVREKFYSKAAYTIDTASEQTSVLSLRITDLMQKIIIAKSANH